MKAALHDAVLFAISTGGTVRKMKLKALSTHIHPDGPQQL